ncbi:hypothetical protein RQP46_010870 [Phenoliferia psychrophenolica]
MFASRWPSPFANLLRHATRPSPALRPATRTLCTSKSTIGQHSHAFLRSYRLAIAVSIPIVTLSIPTIGFKAKPLQCAAESDRAYARPAVAAPVVREDGGEAQSIINWTELSFGTVAGICVGVFVKKGLKAVAFALGGVFVLMQYFSSRSFISINWGNVTSSYDSVITRKSGVAAGGNRALGLGATFVDFVTADVQGRATFVAGMLLGFRIG